MYELPINDNILLLTNFQEYHWFKVNTWKPCIFNSGQQASGILPFFFQNKDGVEQRDAEAFHPDNALKFTYLLVWMQLPLNPSFKGNQ